MQKYLRDMFIYNTKYNLFIESKAEFNSVQFIVWSALRYERSENTIFRPKP